MKNILKKISPLMPEIKNKKGMFGEEPRPSAWVCFGAACHHRPGFRQRTGHGPKDAGGKNKEGERKKDLPFILARFVEKLRFMNNEQAKAAASPYPAITDDMPYTEFPLIRFLAFSPFLK